MKFFMLSMRLLKWKLHFFKIKNAIFSSFQHNSEQFIQKNQLIDYYHRKQTWKSFGSEQNQIVRKNLPWNDKNSAISKPFCPLCTGLIMQQRVYTKRFFKSIHLHKITTWNVVEALHQSMMEKSIYVLCVVTVLQLNLHCNNILSLFMRVKNPICAHFVALVLHYYKPWKLI